MDAAQAQKQEQSVASSERTLAAKAASSAASANRKLYGAIAPKGSELVIFTFIAKLCIFFLHAACLIRTENHHRWLCICI